MRDETFSEQNNKNGNPGRAAVSYYFLRVK